ncbi:MAG: CopG family transcriptional regulator [Thermoanaerobaculum sp.]
MGSGTKTTLYLDEDVRRALRLKAALENRTLSELVNSSLRELLSRDLEDLAAFRERADDPLLTYEELLAELRAHGKV